MSDAVHLRPSSPDELPCWIDGRLLPGSQCPRDSNGPSTRGCYTTARVQRGELRWAERHVRRLVRDARDLGLGAPDAEACRRALHETAIAAFHNGPDDRRGDGIVRLEAQHRAGAPPRLVARARRLGPDPASWQAIVSPRAHPERASHPGAKVLAESVVETAREAARVAGADEALIFDAANHLIEGSRTNLMLVLADGTLLTPSLEKAGVAGLAREIALEEIADVQIRPLPAEDLPVLREIIALNAVRGARPIVALDGRDVGDGKPGPWARRLAALLAAPNHR